MKINYIIFNTHTHTHTLSLSLSLSLSLCFVSPLFIICLSYCRQNSSSRSQFRFKQQVNFVSVKQTEAFCVWLLYRGQVTTESGGCPCGVMVKAMDCGIVVREFVLQSRYYVHFWANTLGKGMNPLILPAMG